MPQHEEVLKLFIIRECQRRAVEMVEDPEGKQLRALEESEGRAERSFARRGSSDLCSV